MNTYKLAWIGLYVITNIIASVYFGITGTLDGDLINKSYSSYSTLAIATFSVVISYCIWMWPVFTSMNSVKIRPFLLSWKYEREKADQITVGIFILLVQFSFLFYNLIEGTNVAGSRLYSDSVVRYLWIFLVPDALFLVYYALYRNSPFFKVNLTVYLISNVMRGWLGTWLIIFFIEGAYRLRERRVNWGILLVSIIIFSLLLPLLIELKLAIREGSPNGEWKGIFSRISFNLAETSYFELYVHSIKLITMRFQHLANVIGIIDGASVVSAGLSNREFLYFFEEGDPQYVFKKLVGIPTVPDVHIMLLTYLTPDQLPVNTITNTHVGLVGWLWISPLLIPVYLAYIVFISWCGVWLAKKAGGQYLIMNLLWFMWLGLLMNGWFAAYIVFLQAIVVMILIRCLIILLRWFFRNLNADAVQVLHAKEA